MLKTKRKRKRKAVDEKKKVEVGTEKLLRVVLVAWIWPVIDLLLLFSPPFTFLSSPRFHGEKEPSQPHLFLSMFSNYKEA